MYFWDLICILDLAFTYFIEFSFSSFSTFILSISRLVEMTANSLAHLLDSLPLPFHLPIDHHPHALYASLQSRFAIVFNHQLYLASASFVRFSHHHHQS